jgi:ATP-dependent DNA helicase RecG
MVLPIDLDVLLHTEGAGVEWKENVADFESVVRKLSAIANNFTGTVDEGWVICGVKEEKDDHGFPRPRCVGLEENRFKALKGKVLAGCRDHVSPPLVPEVHELEVPGDPSRRILVFYLRASPYAHVFHTKEGGSRYWIMVDSETREAKGELHRELLRRKQAAPPLLDQPCPGATMQDIDRLTAEEFLREASLPQPSSEYLKPDVTIDAIARPLIVSRMVAPGVLEPIPTHLAILLFGRVPTSFSTLSGAYVVFSVYDGTSRTGMHSQRFEAVGPIPTLIRDILGKLRLYTGIVIEKTASALESRQNRPRYSDKALQEAVVNALAHRDYESSEPTRITVFSDRIEISSPGGLVPGVDAGRLKEGRQPARWRNASLASFLLRMGMAQNEGQGIPTILAETMAVSGRQPQIETEPDRFDVVLPAYRPAALAGVTRVEDDPGSDGLILISIGAKSIRPVVEHSLEELNLKDAKVLVEFTIPDYVDPDAQHWEAEAKRIRNDVKQWVEDPRVKRLHLFYRGPVVIAPLLGLLIAPVKPLVVYHYQNGRYGRAYTLDNKFRISED